MITAVFTGENGRLTGIEVQGHSTQDAGDEEGRLVCAAVSSAAIMAANTITEVLCEDVSVHSRDGYLQLGRKDSVPAGTAVLEGLRLHLQEMSQEYPGRIQVIMEVKDNA